MFRSSEFCAFRKDNIVVIKKRLAIIPQYDMYEDSHSVLIFATLSVLINMFDILYLVDLFIQNVSALVIITEEDNNRPKD